MPENSPLRQFTCGGCHKLRVEPRFSKTSIRKYESALRQAQIKAEDDRSRRRRDNGSGFGKPINLDHVPRPRCTDCTAGNVVELKCAHCDVSKRLESFSKQMRKNPDNALCLDCSQDRQDLEPEHMDQVQEEIVIDRLRTGATMTSMGHGSTTFSHSGNSHAMARSNGFSASTNIDGSSDWINPPIPIPNDPRVQSDSSSSYADSPSVISHNTYASNASAVRETGWKNFERENAPYREQMPYLRGADNTGSRGGGSGRGFAKQGAVRQDQQVKALNAFARLQIREAEQAEQAALKGDDDESESDSDSDSEPAY